MPPSLPNECFSNVLSFLDRKSLYKCLFINRFYCKLSIPIIWKDPFTSFYTGQFSLINTLLACLNEDEISSLIPCVINFDNQPPLFEYEKFIRKIVHRRCVGHIQGWLKLSSERVPIVEQDCRVRKLFNVIYHMIMRQGSNLQELIVNNFSHIDIDLPKFSVFTTYKPGITNLRSFNIYINLEIGDKFQNNIEFLSMVSNFCNSIVDFELWINDGDFPCTELLDFIKLQPLERIFMYNKGLSRGTIKKIIPNLELRSETLKELSFENLDFQSIDLSFLSKLEYLERLEFQRCYGLTFHKALSKKMLHLKELKLWCCGKVDMVNYLCSEKLLKLSLTDATSEIIKVVKESCPKISFLNLKCLQLMDLMIPLICELSSLGILRIGSDYAEGEQVRILGDYLTFVEYLLISCYIELSSFEYFTNNCKADLKKWIICINNRSLRKDYLDCVNNYQKVHNSLKVLGIFQYKFGNWTDEELEIVNSLKNQGIDIVLSDDDDFPILKKLFV